MFVLVCKADPEEFVALHLGLHCLPKYMFPGVQNENGSSLSLPHFPRKLKKENGSVKIFILSDSVLLDQAASNESGCS